MAKKGVWIEGSCPICSSRAIVELLEILQVPVHCNLLWPTREAAVGVPRGDIRLGFCQECGHIFNQAFRPELMEYSQDYENSLHCSPRFQSYAESLAARLVERYDLRGKRVIEIGCGNGEFLALLCELGHNRGVGFDPSYYPEPTGRVTTERATFIDDFYSERYADYEADLICSRHLLEHIDDPMGFLSMLRRAIGNGASTAVFFEVPNVLFTLHDFGIWDIIYEHFSYFSPGSLARAFTTSGFDVLGLSHEFEDQFLCIDALPGHGVDHASAQSDTVKLSFRDIASFAADYQQRTETWRHTVERMESQGRRAVVWGAGSKGVSFLNTLSLEDRVEYAVDINPRKQGMHIAGTGQQIVSPDFLREYQPDVAIVVNPIYKNEIQRLAKRLDLTVEVVTA
jgi:SAM-dependent methyltransferase